MKLDIIIPAYNEERNVTLIHDKIEECLKDIDYTLIYVNDGSTDSTYKELKELYKKDKRVKVVNFSRNFGKEAAIYAGLEKSTGDLCALIDADLEQNPKYLKEMYNILIKDEDTDEVAMINTKRTNNTYAQKKGSRSFYKLINLLSDVEFKADASDFRMFTKDVRSAILKLSEKNRFTKGIFSYVGFNVKYIPYEVEKRNNGKSKFNFKSSFKYAIDGIISYSVKPLKIATILGFIASFLSFVYLIYIIIKTLILGVDTPGFATIASLILFMGGIELICIGILGEYLSKTFIETKNRPIYIENKSLGFDEDVL